MSFSANPYISNGEIKQLLLCTNPLSEVKGNVAEVSNVVPLDSDVKNDKALGKGPDEGQLTADDQSECSIM